MNCPCSSICFLHRVLRPHHCMTAAAIAPHLHSRLVIRLLHQLLRPPFFALQVQDSRCLCRRLCARRSCGLRNSDASIRSASRRAAWCGPAVRQCSEPGRTQQQLDCAQWPLPAGCHQTSPAGRADCWGAGVSSADAWYRNSTGRYAQMFS